MQALKKVLPRRINFEKNHNNKLLCNSFLIVDKDDNFYHSEVVQVRIRDQHFCFGRVVLKIKTTLSFILDNGLNYIDMGLDKKAYIEYICSAFNKRARFESGKEIVLYLFYFDKVAQLNLFDENEKFTTSEQPSIQESD